MSKGLMYFILSLLLISSQSFSATKSQTFIKMDDTHDGKYVFSECKTGETIFCTSIGDSSGYTFLELQGLLLKLKAIKTAKLGVSVSISGAMIATNLLNISGLLIKLNIGTGILYADAVDWAIYTAMVSLSSWLTFSEKAHSIYAELGRQISDAQFLQLQQNAVENILLFRVITGVNTVHFQEALFSLRSSNMN